MDILLQITYIIIPLLLTSVVYFFRAKLLDIDRLKQKQQEFVTRDEVHQIINDKLEPLRDDIQEIKQTLTKLYDFLLRKQ